MDLYMMNCELLATCSALGYLEGDTYHKEPDCLESVKDLIRYLRHEDDARDIRQQLGAAQILQNDLVPLVIQHHHDKALFEAIVRLMVNLTQPALLCFGKVPEDPTFRHHFLQVVSHLQAYKEAFANEKLFGVLSEKLYDLLQLDWEQREDEDNLLIERILLLVRNILHIPADPEEEKSVDDDASTHDKVLWAIHMSGMDDLVKFLASAQSEQQWTMHVLEIVSLMFRDQKPEHLAATGQARAASERGTDMQELELLRQREMAERKSRIFQRGSRHSRFGGSYVVQGLKAIGDRDVVFHKGLHTFKNYSHDLGKPLRRVPKRKQEAKETARERRSALNVRLFLKEFCVDFLENCYNRLMYIVKDHLLREKAQEHDETYYMWSMAFFMAFNRLFRFRPELVSETVSIRTFHFIEKNLTNYYEMMLMDKKEATSWSRRMHLALKSYQELLTTVHEMDLSKDEAVRDSSRIIKNNIFYLMEYRELFLALFRKFNETTQPRSFLKDLVETTHLFLRMLEKFCKGKNNLIVQSKKNKRKKKKKKSKATNGASAAQKRTPEQLEEIWQSLSVELGNCTTGSVSLPEDVMPFDAASEIPVEEQRAEAMVRIQDGLLANRGAEALSLLRTAREVWPEGDVFGSPDLNPEEETQLLKQILFADLPRQTTIAEEAEDFEDNGDEEEEAQVDSVHVSEKEFNFLDYLKRFGTPQTVRTYLLLLKHYPENSTHTNHCVVKMLHRISCDLKMEGLLFQLSVFHLFNRIFNDPAASVYKELVTFAKYVVHKFFALAATNSKAYVELLFWKNSAAVTEMKEGYTTEGASKAKSKRVQWTPEEETQLRDLYLQYKEVEGIDVIDNVLANLRTPNHRTRRQVILHLVEMNLINNAWEFKRERKGTGIVVWTEEQEIELKTLYEEYEATDDVLGNIMKMVTAKRSRARIIDKLISLGLVSDRKELHKKRARKSKPAGMSEEEFMRDLGMDKEDDSEEDQDDDDDESEEEVHKERNEDNLIEKKKEKKKEKRPRPAQGKITEMDEKTKKLLRRLQQEGFSGPLLWLQNCLNRTAGDREEDGISQAVPLVPLTEENEDAMENNQFQKLLKAVGIRPPANEQESFWRIPAKLSSNQLRSNAGWLSLPSSEEEDAREEMRDEGTVEPQPEGISEEASEQGISAEQRAEALRALLLARKKKPALPPPAAEDIPGVAESAAATMESESEPEASANGEENAPLKPTSKRCRLIDSDDDDDEEGLAESKDDEAKEAPGNEEESDDEGSHRPTKRKRLLIDDDEDD